MTHASDSAATDTRVAVLEAQVAHWRQRALQAETDVAGLRSAMPHQQRIGAAVGILMSTMRVTDDAAFQLLVQASQSQNRKLRAIAEDVVLTGLPPSSVGATVPSSVATESSR
ncbi:ANTAR domain-containing protein [Jatrophihabitans sp. YIM 134969]